MRQVVLFLQSVAICCSLPVDANSQDSFAGYDAHTDWKVQQELRLHIPRGLECFWLSAAPVWLPANCSYGPGFYFRVDEVQSSAVDMHHLISEVEEAADWSDDLTRIERVPLSWGLKPEVYWRQGDDYLQAICAIANVSDGQAVQRAQCFVASHLDYAGRTLAIQIDDWGNPSSFWSDKPEPMKRERFEAMVEFFVGGVNAY